MNKQIVMIVTCGIALVACGGSGSDPDSTTTFTLTGQVAVTQADFDLAVPMSQKTTSKSAPISFDTVATTPAADFNIALYKIKADGSEELVSGKTATTDASGNYTLEGVEEPTTGTGAATDFYYEVRATNASSEFEVRAPTAPAEDGTVNLSPETTLAAKMLTNVANVPGQDAPPTPLASTIENMRTLPAVDIDALMEKSGITTSVSTSDTNQNNQLIAANALATAGGNSEWMLKTFESEGNAIAAAGDASAAAPYLMLVTQNGCNFNQDLLLPLAAVDALADVFAAGTTYTATEVVAAYNANHGGEPEADAASSATEFGGLLTNLDTNFTAETEIADDDIIALLTKRDLVGTAFAADTALAADQSLAFIQSLFQEQCNPGTADLTGIVADLTGSTDLASSLITDAQIYVDKSADCPGVGHFQAEVQVYTPAGGPTVSGVTVTGDDIGGTVTLTAPMLVTWTYPSDSPALCVDFSATEHTYTITATLSDASTITQALVRNHADVAEPTTTFGDGTALGEANSPTPTTYVRPMFTWTSPEDNLAATQYAPTGSQIKYSYEFAHVDTSESPIGPLPECDLVAFGKLYNVNNFMTTVDCDPTACAAASGSVAANIGCRFSVQAYLVDEYNAMLGKAAGDYGYFCVDTDGDDICD